MRCFFLQFLTTFFQIIKIWRHAPGGWHLRHTKMPWHTPLWKQCIIKRRALLQRAADASSVNSALCCTCTCRCWANNSVYKQAHYAGPAFHLQIHWNCIIVRVWNPAYIHLNKTNISTIRQKFIRLSFHYLVF